MRAWSLVRLLLATPALAIGGCLSAGSANHTESLVETISEPRPAAEWPGDTPGVAQAGRFFFAGQPGGAGLRCAASLQVEIVVNLRTDAEMAAMPFDEEALVSRLGMKYVRIPVTPSSFCLEDVQRLAKVIRRQGKILIHDGTSDRAGAMWAALVYGWDGRTLDESIRAGGDAGLRSPAMIAALRREAPAFRSRKAAQTDWPVVRIQQARGSLP